MQVSSCPAKLSHVEDYYYGMEVSPCRGKFSCHADSIWRDDAQFAAHSNEVDWNLRSEHAWAMACRLNGKMIWPPPLEIQTGVEELEEENKRIVELNKVVDAFCEALAPKYNEILARLREAEDYKDALRNENTQLQAEMAELEQRNLFKEAQIRMLFRDELYAASPVSVQSLSPPSAGSFSIPEKGLNRSISDNIPLLNPSALSDLSQNGANVSTSSNNYLTQQNFINQSDSKKPKSNIGPALPKSISIRTNSLLGIKTKSLRCVRQRSLQRDQESSSKTTSLPSLSLQSTEKDKSKVLEQHSNIVETMSLEIMEWEVFVQGMYKTELCNKWQKQGNCPYGSRCQFAHGVEELRPVLRHPRYKTELCRMIGNGETCPYGHRCHFRHSLTKEEKRKLAAPNL